MKSNNKKIQVIGSTRTGRGMLYTLLVLAVIIALFLVVIFPMTMVKTKVEANIKVPANATPEMVNDTLQKYFGEKFTNSVLRLAKMRGIDISKRHGAYTIEMGSNSLQAMRRLTSGAQTPVRITINGFRSLPLLLNRISNKLEIPVDSLTAVINDPDFMSQYGLTPESALALFLENTYEVYWTSSARDVIRKIGDNYLLFWERRNEKNAAALGLTPEQVMIIASIVDEETNQMFEKGVIGRLYINRLHKNMKLQADPTVRFAIGDFTIQRISHNDLKFESPYNTYLHAGLPPGPIRTTSEQTVMTILESEPHNYLYMCANEDFNGGHNFAVTYDEHLVNAARYQKALDERGITR